MAGGGAAPPPKQEELQPHPVKDQLPSVSYCITSPPPWRTSLSPTYLGLFSFRSLYFGIYVLVMWIFPFDVDVILLRVGHWVWVWVWAGPELLISATHFDLVPAT